MTPDQKEPLRIGRWEIHPELNRIVSGDTTVTLEGKVMDVLMVLAQSPQSVISKQDILDSVWRNQTVAEGVLTRAIHELRTALGDDASAPIYIETVPRRGYRLLTTPQLIAETADPKVHARLALVVAALLGVAGIGYLYLGDSNSRATVIDTVAVLPFENMTGTAENDYVSDGLAESVIHSIAQLPDIGVTARTSSFALRDEGLTAEEVGRQLDVDKVIEGSVRQQAEIKRLTLQLIDVRTGLHDESTTVDIVDGDLFGAQERISRIVADMLARAGARIDSSSTSSIHGTTGPAYDLFLKGRAALHNRSAESLQNALKFFEEAIAQDPSFADAHAGLAQVYLVSRIYLGMDQTRSAKLASESVEEALALDPNNTDALMVAAAVASYMDDYDQSIAKFRQAIESQPSNAQAQQWFGELLMSIGYLEEGRRHIENALRLNPLAGSTNSVRAKAGAFFIDDEQHFVTSKQGVALGALMAPRELAFHYFRSNDPDQYERNISTHHQIVGVDASAAHILAEYMRGNIPGSDLIEKLAPLAEPRDGFFAREYAQFGFHREALDSMLRATAVDAGFASDIWLPEFRQSRAYAEFSDLIRSLGFDNVWRKHGLPDVCNGPMPETFCTQVIEDLTI